MRVISDKINSCNDLTVAGLEEIKQGFMKLENVQEVTLNFLE